MSAYCCKDVTRLADQCMHGAYGPVVGGDCRLLTEFAEEAEAGYDPETLTPRPFPPPTVQGSREGDSWWILFPGWARKNVDGLKGAWHELANGSWGNLRGFEFRDQWDEIGERYTFDPATGKWDR